MLSNPFLLFSLLQATPQANLGDDVPKALTKRAQDGGAAVVDAKAGKGSATLSMAYAGAYFADACLKGLNMVSDVIEPSFVHFFSKKMKNGLKMSTQKVGSSGNEPCSLFV
ncbi:unnamed protein product [Lupinus luteus]|uniref:Lactate/malate dehydrogenase C-terminal domain-containing protein n=1 Tax=Lupinus luteus TaxID=3873 RepID=A0AAV1YLW6_LUPLU